VEARLVELVMSVAGCQGYGVAVLAMKMESGLASSQLTKVNWISVVTVIPDAV
jgi:hypothetical protein